MDKNWTVCSRPSNTRARTPYGARRRLNGRHVWLWNLRPGKAAEYVAAASLHGWDGFIVKAHDGTSLYNEPATIAEYVSHCATAKLRLGLWGYLTGRFPEAEAELAVHLCRQYHADFYIADAETEYEHAEYPASVQFTRAFRKLAPGMPAMLSSFGRVDFHKVNWPAWRKAGFHFAPQAYYNESRELTPAQCDAVARRYWPARMIHPTIPVYKGALGRPTIAEHLHALQGRRDFSVWAGDFMDAEEWKALGKA